jgi:tetratricopeptide (TPR) repeat protein
MAYQLVCGRLPFDASTPLKVAFMHLNDTPAPLEPRFEVPTGLDDWIGRLLQKDPSARFEKAADAARALAELSGGSSDTLKTIATQAAPTVVAPGIPTLPTPPPMTGSGPTRISSPELQELLAHADRHAHRANRAPQGSSQPYEPDCVPLNWRPSSTPQPHSLVGVSPRLYGLRAIPVVGREAQRDQLWEALRSVAKERRPRLVVLDGPSGCGKSCLAQWLCERADEVGAANTMRATHSPEWSPNDGLRGMVTRWANSSGLSAEETRSRLTKLLDVADDEHYRWLVDDVTGLVCGADAETVNLADQIQAVFEMLRRLASHRPLVVWLDDLQWAESAMRLLEHLGDHADTQMPVLFCATVQSEALAERDVIADRLAAQLEASHAQLIELEALSDSENRALIDELLQLDEALAQRVARRVAGNPLFAVQLVGDWVERGWLIADQRGFRLREGVHAELPDDLHTVWVERIERVLAGRPSDDTTALWLAALLGRDIDAQEWGKACWRAGVAARATLFERLVELKLAERLDSGWRFVHGMLRESLLRQARAADGWAKLNRQTAAALEALADEVNRPDLAPRIGRLLLRGGDTERAISFLSAGAKFLLSRDDFVAAEELVDLLFSACDDVGDAALAARLEGELVRGKLLSATRRIEQAVALSERVYDLAIQHGWKRIAADALELRCKIEQVAGRLHGAALYARRALDIYKDIGDREGEVRALLRLGDNGSYVGEHEEAVEYYRAALQLADELGLVQLQAWCRWGIGYCLQQTMRLDEAREHLEVARELFEAAGQPRNEMSVVAGLSDLDRHTGHYARAKERALRVYRFMEARGGSLMIPSLNIAMIYFYEGDVAHAIEWTRRAEDLAPSMDRGWTMLHLLRLAIATYQGDINPWETRFAMLTATLEESGFVDIDLPLMLERVAQEAVRHHHAAQAAQALTLAADLWEQTHILDRARQARRRAASLAPA